MAAHLPPLTYGRIPYASLKGKAKEVFNRQELSAALNPFGHQVIPLDDDDNGADFLLKTAAQRYYPVQLKGRLTVALKYTAVPDLHITFPYGELGNRDWYIAPHTDLVAIVTTHVGTPGAAPAYGPKGVWHTKTLGTALITALEPYKVPR